MKKTILITTCLTGLFLIHTSDTLANERISTSALKYINTPYRYGGVTPSGFDCSGYVQYIYSRVGISLPRTSREQAMVGVEVPFEQLQVGDIVYFKQSKKGPVTHSGIYIGDYQFVSSTTSDGVRIDHLIHSTYWSNRYAGARRITNTTVTNELSLLPYDTLTTSIYSDIPIDAPSYDKLLQLNNLNIMKGVNDKFLPNNPVTRLEMAAILSNILTPVESPISIVFQDIATYHWGHSSAELVVNRNLIPMFADGTFRPELSMSYGQILEIFQSLEQTKDHTILLHYFQKFNVHLNEPMTRLALADLLYFLFIEQKNESV